MNTTPAPRSMLTILTVDDGAANRRLLRAILEAEDFRVVEAADGIEALAALERETVDVMISDVLMPNMDGFRLCLEVRKHARYGSLPVIIYTSTYNSASDRKLALDAGADDYIVKPAPAATVLDAIARARARAVNREGRPVATRDEFDVIKQYNAALVSKLEERNAELVAKNDELGASEERFRQLAESIHEVFWLTDPAKQTMLYVSPAYETIWGRSVASLLKSPRTWLDAIHPEDRPRVAQAAAVQQARGDYDEEYRIVRPDGVIRWIRDRAFPVRNVGGEIYRLAGVAEDITERKQLEEQFRQAQKMEAIGQLAGGVAHDFNNLLTVILMHVTMLERELGDPAAVAEGLQEIQDAATRAANLTRQLLMFSRRQTMQVRPIDVNEVVAAILRMVRRIVGEPVALDFRAAPQAVFVRGDAGMLEQVLMNLVVNARDAMPLGGKVVISTGVREIDAAAAAGRPEARPGSFVWLAVSDTGTGIPADVLPHIFEPFFTTKEVGHGTGLGLATVYGIAQQHQGWIEVESVVGQGTTFTLYLPREGAPQPAPPHETVASGSGEGHETILVVEDDAAVRKTVIRVLARYGYKIIEARNGVEALAIWSEKQVPVHLLLTDLVLPGGMSGHELAARVRRVQPELPVIFTSGYKEQIATGIFTPVAGEDFLAKPYEIDDLIALVRRRLDTPPASNRGPTAAP